jgi:hypothetical protein
MATESVTTKMEEKIKQVITDYIKRVLKICETSQGSTSDYNIDCPKCQKYRSITWNGNYWACGWIIADFISLKI